MLIPVILPVKPHILQFIIHRYGDGQSHEIKVRKMTFLGDMLTLALTKNTFMEVAPKPPKTEPFLLIQVPCESKFMEVPRAKIKALQDALDRHFRDCLISFVMGYHFASGEQMQAVKKFLAEHGLHEDLISSDTAWKIWRDFEGKIERKRANNFRELVGASRQAVGKIGNPSVNFAYL